LSAYYGRQIEALGKLDPERQSAMAQSVANDLQERTSRVAMPYVRFNRETNSFPRGSEIVDAPLKEAEVAVNHFVEPGKRADTLKLLRLDRNLLEIYAVRGRSMMAYTKRKASLGYEQGYEKPPGQSYADHAQAFVAVAPEPRG
jgi:hypothetical protein